MNPDITKEHYYDLPMNISDECWNRLAAIGMANNIINDETGERNIFQSTLDFFHQKRWVPSISAGENRISPVEQETFCICRSMQNCQRLTSSGGCCKYCCKYISKIDQQNYITVSMDPTKKDGSMVTKSYFLHNTKVSSSEIAEEKEKDSRRDSNHPQGLCIAMTQMLHHMLRYAEVITDLNFVVISTLPLELRMGGIKVVTDNAVEDGAFVSSASNHIRNNMNGLPDWRQHTSNEMMTFMDIKQSKVSVDKVMQFSLRPPELRSTVDKVGNYYRWFYICMKDKISSQDMEKTISVSLDETHWIDGLQRQVKLQTKAIPELIHWCSQLENEDHTDDGAIEMIQLFRQIEYVTQTDIDHLSDNDKEFLQHAQENLLYDNENEKHLPIPVYTFLKPSMGYQFLLHILLSMGRFSTEIDLTVHATIRDAFCYAKLIGSEEDKDSLHSYSHDLSVALIKEQLHYFPNSMKVLQSFIVMSGDLFDGVIIKNEMSITEMPPVQLSVLNASLEEDKVKYRNDLKKNIVDAIFLELGNMVETCNIPAKEDLYNTSIESSLDWDPVSCFRRNIAQNGDSYTEQKSAITTCKNAIDSYCSMLHQTQFTKSVIIRGHPGAGKTFCMLYATIYAISKGLNVITTAQMAKRALQLGGKHWHNFMCIASDENITTHALKG